MEAFQSPNKCTLLRELDDFWWGPGIEIIVKQFRERITLHNSVILRLG